MELRRIYSPGYKAYNGHVFTRDDCDRYNRIQDAINSLVLTHKIEPEDALDYLEDYSIFVFDAITNNK